MEKNTLWKEQENKPKRKNDMPLKYFDQKELKKFFDTIEKSKTKFWLRDLTAFQIIYCCGLRASELQHIALNHYRPEAKELQVKRLKGSVCNTIRLLDDKAKLLNRYIKEYWWDKLYQINSPYTPLFKTKNGEPMKLETLRFLMKFYGQLAHLPKEKLHPHSLKHSIAIHLAESGADVKDLQYYLWHKNINNTTKYFQYTTKQMDNFYGKISSKNSIV